MSIVFTNRGSLLVVQVGNVSQTFNKRALSISFTDPNLEMYNGSQRLFKISDHTEVVSPDSESMEDLREKLNDLISTGETSGGGGGDLPIG